MLLFKDFQIQPATNVYSKAIIEKKLKRFANWRNLMPSRLVL